MLDRACRMPGIGLLLLVLAATLPAGCAPLVVGGAAGTAVKATEERGVSGVLGDTEIHTRISELWFKHSLVFTTA